MEETLLQKTKALAIARPELFTPLHLLDVSRSPVIMDISQAADEFLLDQRDEFDIQEWVLARPGTCPNPVWFEYVFPEKANVAGVKLALEKLSGKRIGILCHWVDNDSELIPQTLLVMLVCGLEETPESPDYMQIPIGMDGRMTAGDVLYSMSPKRGLFERNVFYAAQSYFGFFLAPVFMQIHGAHYQE